MRKRSKKAAWLLWAPMAGALWLTGCGESLPPGPKKFKVTGTVTLDGKPLETGAIRFLEPKVSADFAPIKNGSFSLEMPAGEKRVEINATKPSDKQVAGAKDGVKESISLIPPEYNSKSTLKETVKEGKNDFKFDLKSAPAPAGK